jgi:hypothetical protein
MVGERIVILAFISLLSVSGFSFEGNLGADPHCTPFVYNDGHHSFTDTTCVFYDSDDKVNYVEPCDDGYVCTIGDSSTANYTCVAETTEKAYHGESCSSNSDCASGTCTNKLCVGLASGSTCEKDLDCAAGLYCYELSDKKTCAALITKDMNCLTDEQCDYGYFCQIYGQNTSGFCLPYFSIANLAALHKCTGYFDKQCQSGYCIEYTDSQTQSSVYECSQVYTSRNPAAPCTQDTDCIGDSPNKLVQTFSKCVCGYSQSGNGYCELLPGDEPNAKLTELYTEWYKSGLEKNCNTVRRGDLACIEAQWDYENFFALQYYLLKTTYWPSIWDVQTEVQSALGADYWEAKEEYELHLSVECSAYKAKEDSQIFTDKTCAYYNDSEDTFYVESCEDGYTCTPGAEATANFTCISDLTNPFAYPGEACKDAKDCISNVCTNGYCKGSTLSAACSLDYDCDPGLYCDKDSTKTCLPVLSKDAACSRDWECDYDYYCHIKVGETSGTCTDYFSVAASEEVESCGGSYVDYQCSTGYCVEHTNESTEKTTYFCSEIFSLNSPSDPCNADVDCSGTNSDKTLTVYSTCSCGYSNDASAYCQLLPGDSAYASYIRLAKKWFNSGVAKYCNTARRGVLDCVASHWDKSDYYSLAYYAARTQYWTQIWKVETEVQKVFGAEYWEASDDFNEYVAVTCTPFVAKESAQVFAKDTCVFYDDTEDNQKFYVTSCEGDDLECQAGETQPGNFTCVAVTAEKAFPGESCSTDDDCAYGKCTEKLCGGVIAGGECTKDEECTPGYYCNSDTTTCTALLSKDATCRRDWQCDYSYFCNIEVGDTTGKCTEYFTVTSGTQVTECADSKVDQKCSSGFCISETNESTGTTTYSCAEVYTLTNPESPCTSNVDCYGTDSNGNQFQSTCTCGLSQAGTAYCELLPGDDAYREYITYVKSWYSSGKAKECNTVRRGSLECALEKWDAENFLALQYFAYRTEYWTQIWDVQSTVQDALTSDYWDAAYEYKLHLPVTCSSYKCKTSKQEFVDDTCSFYEDQENAYYLKSCSQGYDCTAGTTVTSNSTCIQSPTVPYAGPGEDCNNSSDCTTDICKSHVCVGKASQESCDGDSKCEAGLYCNDAKVCVDLLKADSSCTRDEECTYGTYCYIPLSGTSGKCTAYMNVKSETQVNSCKYGNTQGLVDYQCESGYCVEEYNESTKESTYYCSEIFTQVNKPEVSCSSMANCGGINSANSTSYSECVCGYSQNGNGYCKLLPGDESYANHIKYYKKWLTNSKNTKCNTARRGYLECAENHWDDESYYSLAYYAYRTQYWHQIQDVASCTKKIYATNYWSAKEDLEDYEDDDYASSLMIATIFTLLLLF